MRKTNYDLIVFALTLTGALVFGIGFMVGLGFNGNVFTKNIRTNKKITPKIELIVIDGQVSDTTYIYKEIEK